MKHWRSDRSGHLILLGGEERIIDVVEANGRVIFGECCDEVYWDDYTKAEALELIEELKQWIEKEVV